MNMSTSRTKNRLITLFALLWMLVLGGLYQWYQGRYIRPFDNNAVVFDAQTLRLPAELVSDGMVHVVHLWDPPCPCNVGNQRHLAELVERFSGRVRFHVWQKPGSSGHLPPMLKALEPLASLPGAEHLPASPAVAIWSAKGELAYFGPYSEGATCSSDNSFIEPVLDALLAGRIVKSPGGLAVGCYCPWSE